MGCAAQTGNDETDLETEPTVHPSHPDGVATGEVVVHRDNVHALTAQRIEIDGQSRHEGLALAGAHLGHPAGVQRGAAHELHVVVTLAEHPRGGFAHDGECLDHEVVEGFATVESRAEFDGLCPQGIVAESGNLPLTGIDVGNECGEGLDALALSCPQDAVENRHEPISLTVAPSTGRPGRPRRNDGADVTRVAAIEKRVDRTAQRGTRRRHVVDDEDREPASTG